MSQLDKSMGSVSSLAVWFSNFQSYGPDAPVFQRQQDTVVSADGVFTLHVPVGAVYTISTIKNGPSKGAYVPPASVPFFPLPYSDDFQKSNISQEAAMLSDQIGAFEVSD